MLRWSTIDNVSVLRTILLSGALNIASTIRARLSLYRSAWSINDRRKVFSSLAQEIFSIDLKYLSLSLLFSINQVNWSPSRMRPHFNPFTIAYFCSLNLIKCPCILNHYSFALSVRMDLNTICWINWAKNFMFGTSAKNPRHELQKSSHYQPLKYSITIFRYLKMLFAKCGRTIMHCQ